MSYDIWVETPGCDHCGRGPDKHGDWNYTSNMAIAWRAAGVDLAEFDGKPAEQCAPILAGALTVMRADPQRFRQYDSPNGWGSMGTLLPALEELLALLGRWPTGTVKVWR